jgi:hypothetical protein
VVDHERRLVVNPALLLREWMPEMTAIGGG